MEVIILIILIEPHNFDKRLLTCDIKPQAPMFSAGRLLISALNTEHPPFEREVPRQEHG